MAPHRLLNRLPRRITGAAAIEFAFVFPMLFAIIYGTVVYGYVYFLQQRINFAAQEAVRAAVSVAPLSSTSAYCAALQVQANQAIVLNFTSGGGTLPAALTPNFICDTTNGQLTITLTYSLTTPTLFPTVTLPMGIGAIPPLPAALIARAVGRLS